MIHRGRFFLVKPKRYLWTGRVTEWEQQENLIYIPLILMGKYLENTQLEDRKGDGRIILRRILGLRNAGG